MGAGDLKLKINLDNYPDLTKEELAEYLKPMMEMLNYAKKKGYLEASQETFQMDFAQLIKEILDGVMDTRSILMTDDPKGAEEFDHWGGHDHHPLAEVNNRELRPLDQFESRFGMKHEEFTVRRWLNSLVWWQMHHRVETMGTNPMYFRMPLPPSLSDYKYAPIVDQLLRNYRIQPAIQLQEKQGAPFGRLITDTGLLDVGIPASEISDTCPACEIPDTLYNTSDGHVGCKNCRAGYRREKPYVLRS